MKLTSTVVEFITTASAKAFATDGSAGLNVVPVSVITVETDVVILYNFFMKKTLENIGQPNTPVALTCWEGLRGLQLRATATSYNKGELFSAAQTVIATQFPDRTLASIIVLQPTAIFDVSVGTPKVI